MARNLKLEVVLQAIDRATKPIRAITQGSGALGRALKEQRDQLKSLNALQSDISSYKKQHTAVRETSETLARAQQRLREMREQLKGMSAPSAAFQKSFINATKEVDRLSRKHREQRTELQQTITRFREAGISTASLKDREKTLGAEIDAVNRKMKVQRDRLAAVALQQERLGKAKQQYQRTQALAGSMAGAGASGLASGSSILYAGARLLTPGIDYGAQMSELQAITRLTKEDERFKALKAQARELGATTAFSATEVGAGQTFLARAGFTPEAIRASMSDILNLALANNTDLARTADIASNISSAFKINPEVEGNITRVADVLSGTAARANVNLEMLGETMKYMGGAEDLGMSLEQAAAMAGVLGNIGIQGSMAGTTMRAMNARITKPSKEAAKVIEQLGLQVTNASGDMREWPEILRDINNATRKLGNVERKSMLQALFGQEAGSGTGELVAQMSEGGLDKLLDQLANLKGENARMAETLADNISGDLKGLRSAWEEVGNTITDTNEGPLREFIQSITGVVRGISTWMNENPRLTAQILKTVAGLGMLLAIGGGITVMLASVIGPFAMVRYGMTLLGIKSLGMVNAFNAVGGAGKTLGSSLTTVGRAGKTLGSSLTTVGRRIGQAWQAASPAPLWPALKALPGRLRQGTKAASQWSQSIGPRLAAGLKQTAAATWGYATGPVRALTNGLRQATLAALAHVRANGLLGTSLGLLKGGASGLWGLLKGGFVGTLSAAGAGVRLLGQAFLFAGRALLLNPIGLAITAIGLAIWGLIKYWEPVKAFFSGFWQGLTDGLAPVREALLPALTSLGSVLAPFKPLWEGIASALGTVWGWVSKLFAPFQATDQQLQNATESGRAFGLWLADLINTVAGLGGKMFTMGADLIGGLIAGITSKFTDLKATITGIGDSITGWFAKDQEIHSPSRVWAALGGYTMAGLAQGLAKGEDGVLSQIAHTAKQLTASGAMAIGLGGALPAMADASPIAFDSRPPIQASTSSNTSIGGATISITINAAPGQDANAIARAVAQELDKRERAKGARMRSALYDQE